MIDGLESITHFLKQYCLQIPYVYTNLTLSKLSRHGGYLQQFSIISDVISVYESVKELCTYLTLNMKLKFIPLNHKQKIVFKNVLWILNILMFTEELYSKTYHFKAYLSNKNLYGFRCISSIVKCGFMACGNYLTCKTEAKKLYRF